MEHLILQLLAALATGYCVFALTAACGGGLALRLGLPSDEAALLPVQYLFGMLAVSLAAFLSLFGWGGPLAAIAILAVLIHATRHPLPSTTAALRDGLLCMPLAALLGLWVGLQFHGPSSTIGGSPMGDLSYYAARAFYMAQHPANTIDFFAEGFRSTVLPAPHIPPVIAAALVRFGLADPFLFMTVTMSVSMALWLAAMLAQGLRGGLSLVNTGPAAGTTLLACVALAAASPGYFHWLFESAPVSVVLPLAALPVALLSCPLPSLRLMFFVTMGWLLLLLVSKVTALSFLATAMLYPLMAVVNKRLGRPAALAMLALLAVVLALIWLLLTSRYQAYMAIIGMDRFSLMPDFIRKWGDPSEPPPYATVFAVLSSLLMVVLAARLERRHAWRLGLALPCLGGALFALFLPSVAIIAYRMAMMMMAVSLIANARRLAWQDVLLCLVVAAGYLAQDYSGGGGMRGLLSDVLFAAVLATPLLIEQAPRIVARTLLYASAALFVLAAAAGLFFRPLQTRAERHVHWLYSTDMHDVWQAVDRLTPQDSLIFTDQTGPRITQLEGWNSYPAMGRRQVFMSNWSEVLPLAVRPDRVKARLQQNQELLLGHMPLRAVPLSRGYSAYFAVVDKDKAVLGPVLYANAHYRLYRINTGLPAS